MTFDQQVALYKFQSTLPLRGATRTRLPHRRNRLISIHTPLAGSDSSALKGEMDPIEFQSTLPLRGATDRCSRRHHRRPISIHTPLAGSDSWSWMALVALMRFQSTLPLRGATAEMRHF